MLSRENKYKKEKKTKKVKENKKIDLFMLLQILKTSFITKLLELFMSQTSGC